MNQKQDGDSTRCCELQPLINPAQWTTHSTKLIIHLADSSSNPVQETPQSTKLNKYNTSLNQAPQTPDTTKHLTGPSSANTPSKWVLTNTPLNQAQQTLHSTKFKKHVCQLSSVSHILSPTGRAIRHKGDYATIVLVDHRYGRPSVQSKLPGWILKQLHTVDKFGKAFGLIRQVRKYSFVACSFIFFFFFYDSVMWFVLDKI